MRAERLRHLGGTPRNEQLLNLGRRCWFCVLHATTLCEPRKLRPSREVRNPERFREVGSIHI